MFERQSAGGLSQRRIPVVPSEGELTDTAVEVACVEAD